MPRLSKEEQEEKARKETEVPTPQAPTPQAPAQQGQATEIVEVAIDLPLINRKLNYIIEQLDGLNQKGKK